MATLFSINLFWKIIVWEPENIKLKMVINTGKGYNTIRFNALSVSLVQRVIEKIIN